MATTQTTNGTLLGRKVLERLNQLGVSRRAFCIANNISRQTLYEIEHQGKVNLMPSSLVAIDTGCHWEPGTAARYASGDASVNDDRDKRELAERYIRTIISKLTVMTIDELERESIWLEEELFGRTGQDMADSMGMIRDAFHRIIPSIDQEATSDNGRGQPK